MKGIFRSVNPKEWHKCHRGNSEIQFLFFHFIQYTALSYDIIINFIYIKMILS